MHQRLLDPEAQARFERIAAIGITDTDVEVLARSLRKGERSDGDEWRLCAAFAHAAFAAPWRIAEIYDAAAEGWLGEPIGGPAIVAVGGSPMPPLPVFWPDFWSLVGDSGSDATSRSVALGAGLDPALQEAAATACLAYPGVAKAAESGFPARTQLSDIAACPPGSLGEAFYRLIVDNQFDLEVLDRDELGLSRLTPPLGYLNARILQAHDLWHIVAGYQTTNLHEIGISAFQMAQFGHGYSAMFLAMIATTSALREPPFFAMIMDTVLSAWAHGRRTPPMMLIPWESVWDQSTDVIRAHYGVAPYASPYPADIFEQAGGFTASVKAGGGQEHRGCS